jgi:hypothetical protein
LNELAKYLFENLIVDFEGEVTPETVRVFLRKDESPMARALMQKIIEENGIDDLLIAVADCLKADLSDGITPPVIRGHLLGYSES